jgi:hypothetical protein
MRTRREKDDEEELVVNDEKNVHVNLAARNYIVCFGDIERQLRLRSVT